MIINGHRRLVVHRILERPTLKIEIVARRDGRSLDPVSARLMWLSIEGDHKPPTDEQILVTLAHIRRGWQETYNEPWPGSTKVTGRLVGRSSSSISRWNRVIDGAPELIEPICKGVISRAQVTKILNAANDQVTLQAAVARVLARSRTPTKRGRVRIMADDVMPDIDHMLPMQPSQQQVQLLQAPALPAERTLAVTAYPARDEAAEWARTYLEVIHTGEMLRDNGELPDDVALGMPLLKPEFIKSLGQLATRNTARKAETASEYAVET